MIIITASARLRADRRERGLAAAAAMAAASRSEDGCVDYRFAVDVEDDLVIRVFEHWAGQEALDVHFTMPHMATFQAELAEVLDGAPEILRYEVTSVGPLFD